MSGHREAISGVQWIDDNTILTGSWDHTLRVWDLESKAINNEINGNKSFFDISYSYVKKLVITSSADRNIRLYDLRSNGKIKRNFLQKIISKKFIG